MKNLIFSEQLKKTRKIRQITQRELEIKAGLPNAIIARLEHNSRKPSFDTLCRIVDGLDVSADYLLGKTDEIYAIKHSATIFESISNLSIRDIELLERLIETMQEKSDIPH